MYETGHSEPRSRDDLRDALHRLEQALARHERQLPAALDDLSNPALQVLHRSVLLMRQEVDRLRALLRD